VSKPSYGRFFGLGCFPFFLRKRATFLCGGWGGIPFLPLFFAFLGFSFLAKIALGGPQFFFFQWLGSGKNRGGQVEFSKGVFGLLGLGGGPLGVRPRVFGDSFFLSGGVFPPLSPGGFGFFLNFFFLKNGSGANSLLSGLGSPFFQFLLVGFSAIKKPVLLCGGVLPKFRRIKKRLLWCPFGLFPLIGSVLVFPPPLFGAPLSVFLPPFGKILVWCGGGGGGCLTHLGFLPLFLFPSFSVPLLWGGGRFFFVVGRSFFRGFFYGLWLFFPLFLGGKVLGKKICFFA